MSAIPTSIYLLYDERMTWHRPHESEIYNQPVCNPELLDENGMPSIFENASRIVRLHQRAMQIERRLTGRQTIELPTDEGSTAEQASSFEDQNDYPCYGGIQPHYQSDCLWATNPAAPHNVRCFIPLEATPCPQSIIELAHTRELYDRIQQTSRYTDEQLQEASGDDSDIYYCRDTFFAATLACGGVVNCVRAVTQARFDTPTRAMALVRPPGHHGTRDLAQGFCFFNNIAVAAKEAIASGRAERVFVLDWYVLLCCIWIWGMKPFPCDNGFGSARIVQYCVIFYTILIIVVVVVLVDICRDIHHGNGIQDICYDDPNIFYLSLHRGCTNKTWFYPGTGRAYETGRGSGMGSNLNISWGQGNMENMHYAAAFSEAVLPVLFSFDPDLIIVACGFDAVKGDLLGDCGLSPHMYYIMTRSLLETCGMEIPLVMVLEGGYNLDIIEQCFEATVLAMLDEPLSEELRPHKDDATAATTDAMAVKAQHLKHFQHHRKQQKLQRKMFHDDQQLTLQRYWHHDYLSLYQNNQQRQQDKITASALSSIKKSMRALVRKGGFRGRLCMTDLLEPQRASPPPPKTTNTSRVQEIVPKCNRPVQGLYDAYNFDNEPFHQPKAPLKKRKIRSASFDEDYFILDRPYVSSADVGQLTMGSHYVY